MLHPQPTGSAEHDGTSLTGQTLGAEAHDRADTHPLTLERIHRTTGGSSVTGYDASASGGSGDAPR